MNYCCNCKKENPEVIHLGFLYCALCYLNNFLRVKK